jgi:hypothetical protein
LGIAIMNYLSGLQSLLERLPIRGKGRFADAVLSNRSGEFECHPLPGVTVSLRAKSTNRALDAGGSL